MWSGWARSSTAHHGRRGPCGCGFLPPLKLTQPPGPIVIRSTCAPERRSAEATKPVAATRPPATVATVSNRSRSRVRCHRVPVASAITTPTVRLRAPPPVSPAQPAPVRTLRMVRRCRAGGRRHVQRELSSWANAAGVLHSAGRVVRPIIDEVRHTQARGRRSSSQESKPKPLENGRRSCAVAIVDRFAVTMGRVDAAEVVVREPSVPPRLNRRVG